MDALSAILIALSGMCTVFLVLVVLCLMIPVISRVVRAFERWHAKASPAPAPAPAQTPHSAAGEVALVGVDEKTAACVMAIVSHETGIPLSELIFTKIKAVQQGEEIR